MITPTSIIQTTNICKCSTSTFTKRPVARVDTNSSQMHGLVPWGCLMPRSDANEYYTHVLRENIQNMMRSRGLDQVVTQSEMETLYYHQHGHHLARDLPQLRSFASHFQNVSVHGIWTEPTANHHVVYLLRRPPVGDDNNTGPGPLTDSSIPTGISSRHCDTDLNSCVGSNSQDILQCEHAQQKGKLTESIYADLLANFLEIAHECATLLSTQQPHRNIEKKINTVVVITNLHVSKMKSDYAPHEIIHASHLLFNREAMLLHSHLQPQSTTDTIQYMRAYNTTPEHLPKVLPSDQCVQYLGLQQYAGVVRTTDNIRVSGPLQCLRKITNGNTRQSTERLACFTKMKDAKCSKQEKLDYQAEAWDRCQTNKL
jgi:hypothetical protein